MAAADYYDDVQKVYVAYYGRPADREGLLYWAGRLDAANGNLSEIINAFGTSDEATTLFGGLTVEQMVSAIYQQLFNRLPDPEGLDFYSQGIMTGKFTLASVMLDVLNGAKNEDLNIINAKLAAADAFTDTFFDGVNDPEEVLAYAGDDNAALAREWLAPVVDSTTATTAEGTIDDTIAEMGGATTGETLVLTDTVDNVVIAAGNTVDTVLGVVDPGTGTFSVGDNIDGNGHTILKLAIADSGTAEFASVKDIATVQLINADAGTINFDAGSWTNIGEIVMDSGTSGGVAFFDNLEAGVDLVLSVDGGLSASYTDGVFVELGADKGDSVSLVDGNLTVTVADSNTAGFYISSTGDLALGDIALTQGDNGSFSSSSIVAGGDLTIGNLVIELGDSSDMGDADIIAANNLTMGDITLVQGDNGGSNDLTISSSSSGDVTVGDISIAIGDNTGSHEFTFDIYANSGNITVGNITGTIGDSTTGLNVTVEAYVGSVTVGDIMLTAGAASTTGDGGINLNISDWDSSGDVTVGDIAVTVGQSATLDVEISATGNSGTTADGAAAALGDMTLGNLTFNLAEDATGSVDIEHYTTGTLTGSSAETIGALTIGDIAINLGADATIDVSITQAMYGTQTSGTTIGDVTIGNLDVELGIGASASVSVEVTNNASGDIGSVTMGDVTAVGDDGSWFEYTLDVSATAGDVGSVTVGNVDVELGVDAGGYFSITINADNIGTVDIGDIDWTVGISSDGNEGWWMGIYAAGDIESVTRGDTTVVLGADASNTYAALSVTATGDIGSVTKGDISYVLGAGAYASYDYLAVYADGNVGTVTQGNLDVTVGADATFTSDNYVSVTASGTIDTVTVGDIAADVAAGGSFDYYVKVSGDAGVGDVTVGDITLSSDGGDLANLTVEVVANTGDIGSVTVGDITLTAAGTSTVSVTIEANGSGELGALNIGNVDLSASVSSSVAVNILTNSVTVLGTDADITIDSFTLQGSGAYQFNVGYAAYAGDITLNNVVVDVSATTSGMYDLTGLLAGVLTTGDVTLGTVDYSHYAVTTDTVPAVDGAVIDVSGFAGDIVVIGSDGDDTITDNTETNTLTGNDGADTFSFVTMNANGTGLTLAKADVITDFEHGVDVIELDVSNAASFSADAYYEGSAASFSAFLTLATTQMTSSPEDNLVAVQVGNDVYVAVDMDNGDSVDTVIVLTGVSTSSLNFADFSFV